MRSRRLVGIVVLSVLALSPIGGSSATLPPEHGYVTNQVWLATTEQQVHDFGRDLDADGTRDNQLSSLFVVMIQATGTDTVDLSAAMNPALTSGEIVMLHSLRAARLTNSNNASWQVWLGAPRANPPLDGTGSFLLRPKQPHSLRLPATITNHLVKTGAGRIPVRLDIGAGPFLLWMTKAKVVARCYQSSCSSVVINGAVSIGQIENKLIPELWQFASAAVAADCTGPEPAVCTQGSAGEGMHSIFEDNGDFGITLSEVQNNPLVMTVLRPDLDLTLANGNPGHDGIEDAISFGFGLTTVHATLVRP